MVIIPFKITKGVLVFTKFEPPLSVDKARISRGLNNFKLVKVSHKISNHHSSTKLFQATGDDLITNQSTIILLPESVMQ
jgi:hypothetical protein